MWSWDDIKATFYCWRYRSKVAEVEEPLIQRWTKGKDCDERSPTYIFCREFMFCRDLCAFKIAFVEISTKGRKASCFCRDEAFRRDLNERLHAFVLFLTDWLTEPPLYLIAWQKFCHSTHHFFDSRPGSTFVLVTFHNFADLADLLRQALYITTKIFL